jgi:hypothetical protein
MTLEEPVMLNKAFCDLLGGSLAFRNELLPRDDFVLFKDEFSLR